MGDPDEDVLVACHLTFCPGCRDAAAVGEAAVAERALGEGGPEVSPEVLRAALARLDAPAPAPAPPPPVSEVPLPAPFLRAWGPFGALPFRAVGRGVRVAVLRRGGPRRTFVVDFPPGFRVPDHAHDGVERGLVLRGGYTHDGAAYGPGDVQYAEAAHHGVTIDPEGPCTALFVADGPPELGLGWLAPLAERWLFGR